MSLHHTPAFPFIKGADIVTQKKIEITPGIAYTCHWEGYGFKVHIPAGAISEEMGPVTLCIQASLSGDYQLPDDGVLVSGVYWLSLHPYVKRFHKKVTVTIQHCASDDDSALSFITAKCTQKTLPYIFEEIKGGVFSTSDIGIINISHFSALGLFGRKKTFYAISTHYFSKEHRNHYEAHIAVIPNLELNRQVNDICDILNIK